VQLCIWELAGLTPNIGEAVTAQLGLRNRIELLQTLVHERIRETANDDPPLTLEEATAMVEAKERTRELDAQVKRAKQLMKKAENCTLTKDERVEYDQLMRNGFNALIDQYRAVADEMFRSRVKR
jgi:hypothetical protein